MADLSGKRVLITGGAGGVGRAVAGMLADRGARMLLADRDEDDLHRVREVAGRVSGVAAIGPGTVLPAGKTVMQIVPDGRALIIEAQISPADIDDVKLGSPATLRFTTINPRGASSFEGTVVALSPTRVPGANGTSAYRAQIKVDDPAKLREENVKLLPGEPVTVHIKTHARTLFNYLFAPLEDAAAGAFREE